MRKWCSKSSRRLATGLFAAAILVTASAPHALAHRPVQRFGWGEEGSAASVAYGVSMAVLILFMVSGLLGALFYFRWRARNPLAEPDSVRTLLAEGSDNQAPPPPTSPDSWERPADWWKGDR